MERLSHRYYSKYIRSILINPHLGKQLVNLDLNERIIDFKVKGRFDNITEIKLLVEGVDEPLKITKNDIEHSSSIELKRVEISIVPFGYGSSLLKPKYIGKASVTTGETYTLFIMESET